MGAKDLHPQPEIVQIEVVQAIPDDLKEFGSWVVSGDGNHVKRMKLRKGIPFWLKSMVTGKFEPSPYIIDDNTDVNEIAEWLKFGMIYIAKHPFRNE